MGRDEALGSTVLTGSEQLSQATTQEVRPRRSGKAVTAWLPALRCSASTILGCGRRIDRHGRMNDYGLVSVLPARIWAALILLILLRRVLAPSNRAGSLAGSSHRAVHRDVLWDSSGSRR